MLGTKGYQERLFDDIENIRVHRSQKLIKGCLSDSRSSPDLDFVSFINQKLKVVEYFDIWVAFISKTKVFKLN